MYREAPDDGRPDSGWRFWVGDEDEAYMDNLSKHHIFSIVIMIGILSLIFIRKSKVFIYEQEVIRLKLMTVTSQYSLKKQER